MSDATRAILASWSVEFWPALFAAVAITVYWRGWRGLHQSMGRRFPRWRLASFIAGVSVCWIALASPLDAFAGLLLQVHMVQHVLLMMVGPPLILLAAPGIPILRGLPHTIRRDWFGPFLASPSVRRIFHFLTHPVFGWTTFVIATWMWHVPALYETAIRDSVWHEIEHAMFMATAFLFWWPVIQPWPSQPVWPRWMLLPYLLAADVQNTLFSAIYVFRESPIYGTYAATPHLLGISTLDDQSAAGAIMWVAGSAVFLVPVALIIKQLLQPRLAVAGASPRSGFEVHLPLLATPTKTPRQSRGDLLRAPLIGGMLRSLRVRRAAQWTMFILAGLIVLDGLFGPRLSPMNAAGVLPWTHWRGLVVIALLLAGNAFCWACPFMLPRELGKRMFSPQRRWPRWLRRKWLAAVLLLVYLWAYEAFGLWDSPWWTAWVVVGYFLAAFVIDALFRGASFCRWVCPIGQFHFVESMISPREVRIKDRHVCRSCTTRDCIKGGPGGRGCELDLFLPSKRSNMDCTFCMDCVRACPHDNIGVMSRPLHADVVRTGWRGAIGRFASRTDIAALAVILTFGAFANALGMVGPVLDWEDQFSLQFKLGTPVVPATIVLLAVTVFAPLVCLPTIGVAAKLISKSTHTVVAIACRLAIAMIPMGFAMWLVHMLFHFLTAMGTIVPVGQRLANDMGLPLGEPIWAMACCLAIPDWLIPLELILLDGGLILTALCVHRLAQTAGARRTILTSTILCLPSVMLWALGVWIVLQPMQMRGTILP